ncbi:MAG: hypothetical protein WCI02_08105 [Planctomycetota bacterium]
MHSGPHGIVALREGCMAIGSVQSSRIGSGNAFQMDLFGVQRECEAPAELCNSGSAGASPSLPMLAIASLPMLAIASLPMLAIALPTHACQSSIIDWIPSMALPLDSWFSAGLAAPCVPGHAMDASAKTQENHPIWGSGSKDASFTHISQKINGKA